MRNFYNIQLALYAVIVASILVWLLVALLDNTALSIGGYYDTCDHTTQPQTAEEARYYQKIKEILESTETIIMPPPLADDDNNDNNNNNNNNNNGDRSNLIISDILPKTPRINIFSSLTRDFNPISSRLDDKSQNTTVLAPLNSAIHNLPRKPWEDPEDYARYGEVNAYKGDDGQERAKRNLLRFVEAHLVPASPWVEGEEVKTVGGGKVKWIKEGGKIFVSWHQRHCHLNFLN
jgi:hypothetical protein